MKKIKLILCLAILAFFVAGMLTSCVGYGRTCPAYAKGAPKHKNERLQGC